MRGRDFVLAFTACLPAALASSSLVTPEYFLLQSKLQANQTGKEVFHNLYMTPFQLGFPTPNAVFIPSSADSTIFSLQQTHVKNTHNDTLYSLTYHDTSYNISYRGDMLYTTEVYANWEPFIFMETTAPATSPKENGFYVNGTASDMELLWSNNYKDLSEGNFQSWMLCDWWWGYPQLFFVTVYAPSLQYLKLPSTCATVKLQVIPIPNNK